MNYRTLGRTGTRVLPVSLGGEGVRAYFDCFTLVYRKPTSFGNIARCFSITPADVSSE